MVNLDPDLWSWFVTSSPQEFAAKMDDPETRWTRAQTDVIREVRKAGRNILSAKESRKKSRAEIRGLEVSFFIQSKLFVYSQKNVFLAQN